MNSIKESMKTIKPGPHPEQRKQPFLQSKSALLCLYLGGKQHNNPGFLSWMGSPARLRNKILFFSFPSQHITGWDANQPEALLATTKQVTEAQQKHTVRLSLMLSAADNHIISSIVQGKVKEPRCHLVDTSPTVLTTMENLKKIQSTDEFHTDTQTSSRSSSRLHLFLDQEGSESYRNSYNPSFSCKQGPYSPPWQLTLYLFPFSMVKPLAWESPTLINEIGRHRKPLGNVLDGALATACAIFLCLSTTQNHKQKIPAL